MNLTFCVKDLKQFLANNQPSAISQLPYSPYLKPHDIQLFPRLKIGLRGNYFASLGQNQETATAVSLPFPKKTFRGASSRTAGASMYMQTGSTLNVTRLHFVHSFLTENYA